MQKHFVLSLCVVSALLILSCAKSEPEAGTNKTAEVKPATTSTPSLTASSSTRIGVPECDDFIVKYDACVSNKVPETARAQYKTSIEQWRNSWKQLAANPQTKPSLVQACKTAAEQARTSMKSFNCDF
ncbi:MAG: hypothetical protein H0V18_02125 [Pyrinomonadaceae bacterium]|nr:hypothetical protein [Pyrinomonadaceae bacterium]